MGHNDKSVCLCLRNKHAVEQISVMEGKSPCNARMGKTYSERRESIFLDSIFHLAGCF